MKTLSKTALCFISVYSLCIQSNATDFLPPNLAFKPTIQGNIINIEIAEGYYLYRDKITVLSKGVPVKVSFITKAITKTFPQLGTFTVYLDHAQLKTAPNMKAPLTIIYQGCSAHGLCYPPQQATLKAQ